MRKLLFYLLCAVPILGFGQTKISDMPAATTPTGTELVPIVQGGANKKATINQINSGYIKTADFYTIGDGRWLKLPSLPGVSQNGKALRWNNGTGLWEYYTPGAGLINGNGTTVNGTGDGVDLGGTLTNDVVVDGDGNTLRFLNGALALRNVANTFDAIFSNTNTANRTYTLPDLSGTVILGSSSNIYTNTNDYTIDSSSEFVLRRSGDTWPNIRVFDNGTRITFLQEQMSTPFSGLLRVIIDGVNKDVKIGTSLIGLGTFSGIRVQATGTDSNYINLEPRSGSVRYWNPANTFYYDIARGAIAANRTLTIPTLTGNDTFVTEAFTQALTNKSVNGVTLTTGGGTTNFLRADGTYAAPSGGGLTVGTSTITSGTNTKVLYNNSGVLGEYTVSGTGNVALTTSPTFTTPALGTPSALVGTNITGTATGLTSGITNALKSATTTVDVSAATAPTSGQVLTATSGTAATWQTPSGGGGAWSLASGGTATGTNTFAMGSNPFILTSGVTTGTGATAGIQNVFNSLTTGNGLDISSSSVSSGAIIKITGTGTAAASNTQSGLVVDVSGANATSTQTTYGGYFSNTKTGTSSTNIAGYFNASGGTNNIAVQISAGHLRFTDTNSTIQFRSNNLRLYASANTVFTWESNAPSSGITNSSFRHEIGNAANASGTAYNVVWGRSSSQAGFTPTYGTGNFNHYLYAGTINQTGGANGSFTGFDVAPTYTSANDVTGYRYNPTVTSVAGTNLSFHATSGNVLLPASSYINIGSTVGSSGYGFRDNAGILESKDSGGDWSPISEIKTVKVTVSSAEILALNTTPKTLIAAPGAGKVVQLISCYLFLDYNTTAYLANTSISAVCNGYVLGTSATFLSSSSDGFGSITPNSANTNLDQVNQALSLQADIGDPTTGNSPLYVYVTYRIITL